VHNGNKIIEIKPSSIDKGNVAQRLAKEFPADFVFAAGDDYTDEAMFAALGEDAITLKVGSGDTATEGHNAEINRRPD
jgi:trehalose 6-phosphate synthase/phosphatase